jgi:DNA-binding MarR family transcriptional regulator
MTTENASRTLMELYPKLFLACHRRHVVDHAARQVVSEHQASILDHLDELHGMSLSRLAAHTGVTLSTMSINVERLVQRGYIARERSETDRRQVLLRLTPAGARIKEARQVLDEECLQAVVARLSDAERETAVEGLRLLARAADEAVAARTPLRAGLRR